ncbi:hypothetical protein ACLBV5_13195 [Brevundimonas sp. M1A4_2e]
MTSPIRMVSVPVDELAQEIRRVDGNHTLGAGALAEALLPFLSRFTAAPVREEGGAWTLDDMRELVSDEQVRHLVSATDVAQGRIRLRDILNALATREEAPAEAGDDVQRTMDGETVCGFKVAAWRFIGPNDGDEARFGHRYCEHWSTVGNAPKRVERLFTEGQLRAALRAQPQAREEAQPLGPDLHAIAKDAAERVHKNGGCVPQMAYAPILFALQDAMKATPPAPEAEKLRVAVDALTLIADVKTAAPVSTARQALAALQQDALSAAPGEAGE